MRQLAQAIVTCLILCLGGYTAYTQEGTSVNSPFDTAKTYRVELKDKSSFVGRILDKDSIQIFMATTSFPRLGILIKEIADIEEVDAASIKDGQYWFPNPNATRYLFAPSGFNLKRGEGYYQNTYILLNSFNVGLTDNLSIGAGIELLSTIASISGGGGGPIFFLTPKVGFEVSKNFHAGAGLLFATVPSFGDDDRLGMGIAYGVGTIGTTDRNLTGGLGWGFIRGDFDSKPIITLCGVTRVARRVALVTENWFAPTPDYHALLSYGVRFFNEKIAVDVAFINTRELAQTFFLGLPYVDFVAKF